MKRMKKTIVTFVLVVMAALSLGFSGLPAFTVFAQGAGDAADAAVSDDQVPPGAGPPATDASVFDNGTSTTERSYGIGTFLPRTDKTIAECNEHLIFIHEIEAVGILDRGEMQTVLACGIKTGRISFWMIPHYIVYFIEFLVGIAGIVAILFLVVGGFRYVLAGAVEGQREAAKATIRNALLGLVIVFISWVVVNTIQFILTF